MIILQKNEQQGKSIQFLEPKCLVNSERTVFGLTYDHEGKARAAQVHTQPSYFKGHKGYKGHKNIRITEKPLGPIEVIPWISLTTASTLAKVC